ncbi:MAG: outer membrane protein transport protein, partial [bacterium]
LAGQKNSITFQFKALMPTTTVTPGYDIMPFYTKGKEFSTEAATYPAGALAVVYGINEKLTAGFSVFAPTAAGATWKDFFQLDPETYGGQPRDATDWDGMMMVVDIHPSIAYKVNEKMSVGLGIAIKYSSITMQIPQAVYSGIPIPPYDYMYAVGKLEGTGMGFGGNIGVLYDIKPNLHVGATFTMPSTLGISGTMTQTLYLFDLTPVMGPFPPYDGSTVSSDLDAKADFPLPMEAGFGVAYDVNAKLTIGIDISYTNWKSVDSVQVKLTGKDPSGDPAEDMSMTLMYENTIRYSIGASYQATPKLNVRAGYYFDPSAIPDDYFTPSILDVGLKHDFALGAEYMVNSKISVSGYFEYVFTNTRTIKKAYTNPDTGEVENVPGRWKLSLPVFGLSVQYNFSVAAPSETSD